LTSPVISGTALRSSAATENAPDAAPGVPMLQAAPAAPLLPEDLAKKMSSSMAASTASLLRSVRLQL
jgi:hypothetical protein